MGRQRLASGQKRSDHDQPSKCTLTADDLHVLRSLSKFCKLTWHMAVSLGCQLPMPDGIRIEWIRSQVSHMSHKCQYTFQEYHKSQHTSQVSHKPTHLSPRHHIQVVSKSTTAHERHEFGDAGRLLYDFFWGEFADWYIEAAKARLYGQDPQAALQTRQVRLTLHETCLWWHPHLWR